MRAALVLAFVLCGVQTTVADPPTPIAAPCERNDSIGAVRRYLLPVLASAGKTGRIYYEAICPRVKDHPLAFPQIEVCAPLTNATDLAAVRSVFREEKGVLVSEDPSGIIRVRIGRVPDAILQTRVSILKLTPIDQFNVLPAIWAINSAPEVQSAGERLHIVLPMRVIASMPVMRPAEGLPHLPAELSNVTVDQALDMVARTWGRIVFYGACTEPGTYEIF
ncbi:MAG TPA: hypothetical protein VGR86_06660 [Steroidobacteraceae bacterium]|nr:hypothetical protein [Steroidobacteraceae bacterium]